jgi:hypothetical protein
MKKPVDDTFTISEIKFNIPSVEVAEHLFSDIMGLPIYLKGEGLIHFLLNTKTNLLCQIPFGKWRHSTLHLNTTTEKLLEIAKKLEKDKMFQPEKTKGKTGILKLVNLNIEDEPDAVHFLSIHTPKEHSTVFITDFD